MLARHENTLDRNALWAKIAAPLPGSAIQWRQDGRPVQRDGKYFARFVAFIDAQFVRERLDAVVPGEWDLTLEFLPPRPAPVGEELDEPFAFKARIQILGVIREDIGQGKDYKTAATDAFKRAAVRFGIGAELYGFDMNWVQVDGEGKYAKPVEDPAVAYARRYGTAGNGAGSPAREARTGRAGRPADAEARPTSAPATASTPATERPAPSAAPATASDEPSCPKCGGRMWDNRLTKRSTKAPDYKCRSRSCDGVIWPEKAPRSEPEYDDEPPYNVSGGGDLPF